MTFQWLTYVNFLIVNNTRFYIAKVKYKYYLMHFAMICNEFYNFKSLESDLICLY